MIHTFGYYDYNYTTNYSAQNAYRVNPVTKIKELFPINKNSSSYLYKTGQTNCQTCNDRRYVDQSKEGNVSFKTPTHISPDRSYTLVSSHEQEHISNAIRESRNDNNQLISASVRLFMSACPECGSSYVSGGVTSTKIQYNENNPYDNARKTVEGSFLKGLYVDYVA